MAADTLQDQIIKYLADVHSLEANAITQLKSGAAASTDPRLTQALKTHLTETEQQEQLVRARLEQLDASPSTIKDLAQKGWATATGAMSNLAPDTTGKIAITAYMFEHLEIASYRSLRAVAEHAGDTETVQLATSILAQEEATAETLSGLLEEVALHSVPQTV